MSHVRVECRACGKLMVWLPTKAGKRMPVNAETVLPDDVLFDHEKHVSHFSDCPQAARFRRPRGAQS
jgi:hypothetical protein